MPKIVQLSPHIANLIAAGEVVERPASVVKELLENAVDAGASKVTVELRDGGMTFLRVTDNGCGMSREDARTAFLRHATSKIRSAEDLGAIGTMGFRGEALAAIASVARVDLMTKTPGAIEGVSLHLEAGTITEESEAGCPEGTTIIVRDLFFNTPARMKFMKSDTVEGAAAASTVQHQALAHPDVAIRLLRDGKEILNTPGDGKLLSAMAGIYGREAASFIPVDSRWEKNRVTGYVTKPTQAKASRVHQTFFVNGRPVKSRLLQAALEEAYRNQMMVGRFPACVLHIQVPNNAVDVNVHPAKTEVKFLWEREVFDCVHYGVLAALRKIQDRPELQLGKKEAPENGPQEAPSARLAQGQAAPQNPAPQSTGTQTPPAGTVRGKADPKPDSVFRTMSVEEYKKTAAALASGPRPDPRRAKDTADAMEADRVSQPVQIPGLNGGPVWKGSAPVPPPGLTPGTPAGNPAPGKLPLPGQTPAADKSAAPGKASAPGAGKGSTQKTSAGTDMPLTGLGILLPGFGAADRPAEGISAPKTPNPGPNPQFSDPETEPQTAEPAPLTLRDLPASQEELAMPATEAAPAVPAEPAPMISLTPVTPWRPEPQPDLSAAQQTLELPEAPAYEILGELFRTYIVVQQGEEAFLIDKHAAHERILFDKLRARDHEIVSQELLVSQVCRLGPERAAVVLEHRALLEELGYGVEEFGEGTILLRSCPMDIDESIAAECLTDLAADLQEGRREDRETLRDELLHTTACKAAIKAGWHTDPLEREALVKEVLSREDLKYCPHGRPVCVKLTKGQLARQFGRS